MSQCQKDPNQETYVESLVPQENLQVVDAEIEYPRLENPYSVTNMKKALKSLQQSSAKGDDNPFAAVNIKATHYYVKFIPRNEAELAAVKRDTLLELYQHPLDVEDWVIRQYFSASASASEVRPPTLWCAVKVDHRLPKGCPSQILERLYIPDEMKHNPRGKTTTKQFPFAQELVEESFRLTGNELNSTTAKAAKWTPSGNIKAQNRPLQGIKVRARRWLTTHVGYTDIKGNFTCDGDFERPANYSLVYERNFVFDVRDGTFGQANVNGLKIQAPWIYNASGGRPLNYGYVYKAAFDYFYKNPFGTHAPPSSPGTSDALKISYHDRLGGSYYNGFLNWTLGIGPAINVYKGNESTGEFISPTKMYAVTSHEVAHAAHWKFIKDDPNSSVISHFTGAKLSFIESWAVFMETRFTKRFIDGSYERWGGDDKYNRNSFLTNYNGFFNEIYDSNAFLITEMEAGLKQSSSIPNWISKMKIFHPHNYEKNLLDEIFEKYTFTD